VVLHIFLWKSKTAGHPPLELHLRVSARKEAEWFEFQVFIGTLSERKKKEMKALILHKL